MRLRVAISGSILSPEQVSNLLVIISLNCDRHTIYMMHLHTLGAC